MTNIAISVRIIRGLLKIALDTIATSDSVGTVNRVTNAIRRFHALCKASNFRSL